MSPPIHSLILKVVSHCNLNCSYCYMYQHEDQSWRAKPPIMPEPIWHATLQRVAEHCDRHGVRMSLMFHGGEPTLLGQRRFERMVGEARDVLGGRLRNIGVQTNGTRLTSDWCDLLARGGLDVSVSLDGPEHLHDAQRVDHRGRGSYHRVVRGLQLLQAAGLSPYVLSVVTPGQSGLECYRRLLSLGVRRFDFLLPDVSHDNKTAFYGNYGGAPVADFMLPILEAWLDEDDPTIEIRVFTSLIAQFMGGGSQTDMFGNPALAYLVIDSDGAIQTLDALRVCAPGASDSGLNVSTHALDALIEGEPIIYQAVAGALPLPTACGGCEYRGVCGGGYLPHRYSRERGFDNPSVWCADIKRLCAAVEARNPAAYAPA